MGKNVKICLIKEDVKEANKHMKRPSASLVTQSLEKYTFKPLDTYKNGYN